MQEMKKSSTGLPSPKHLTTMYVLPDPVYSALPPVYICVFVSRHNGLVTVCFWLRNPHFSLSFLHKYLHNTTSICCHLWGKKEKKKEKFFLSLISAFNILLQKLQISDVRLQTLSPLFLVTLTYCSWKCQESTLTLLHVQLEGEAAAVGVTQVLKLGCSEKRTTGGTLKAAEEGRAHGWNFQKQRGVQEHKYLCCGCISPFVMDTGCTGGFVQMPCYFKLYKSSQASCHSF